MLSTHHENETTFEVVAKKIPEEILQVFSHSLQAGCWPDGRQLTRQQRRICSEALLVSANNNNEKRTH